MCKSQKCCLNCQRKHHTSLCSGKPSQKPITETTQDQPREPSSVHATITPITPASINSTNINMSGTTCLLITLIAMVGSEQFKAEANIQFDEGAQRSFIRQDLVRQLPIKPTRKENVCLSAFGATTPAVRQLDVVTLTLMTDTNEQLTLEALVVPEIATPFQNHLPSIVPNLQYLKGLKLAHPVTANEQFDISLLIRVDYY